MSDLGTTDCGQAHLGEQQLRRTGAVDIKAGDDDGTLAT